MFLFSVLLLNAQPVFLAITKQASTQVGFDLHVVDADYCGLLQIAGPAAAGAHKGVGCEVDEPDDVAAERVRVEGLVDYDAHPIIVRQLNKTYPGLDGQPPKVRCSEVACLSES